MLRETKVHQFLFNRLKKIPFFYAVFQPVTWTMDFLMVLCFWVWDAGVAWWGNVGKIQGKKMTIYCWDVTDVFFLPSFPSLDRPWQSSAKSIWLQRPNRLTRKMNSKACGQVFHVWFWKPLWALISALVQTIPGHTTGTCAWTFQT